MSKPIINEFYTISELYTSYLKKQIYLDNTSPFVSKNWNIGFMYIRRTGLFSQGYLTKYNMFCTTFRVMLAFFTYSLISVRYPRVLFISHSSLPITEFILNLHIFKRLRHIVYGIDYWFSGFLTIRRRNNQYARFLKGLREKQLYIGLYARTTAIRSRYMKNIIRYLRKPSIMLFLKNIGTSYFAGYESYVKTIPSIALISPESKSFGFSGMTFTIPFPFLNKQGHLDLQSFFLKMLWYTDFLNQKQIQLERIKLEKSKRWHVYKYSKFSLWSLFCHYQFCYALSQQRVVMERDTKMQYDIYQPEVLIGSRDLYRKINQLKLSKKYIKYNILYACNIMLSFFIYCIWKRQGQLYDNSSYMYIFKSKPLYNPFMVFLKFFLQFKKQIFQYIPSSVLSSKYFDSFTKYLSKNKNVRNFRFTKHDMSVRLRNSMSSDFFLTVRKLRVFNNLNNLMYERILKKTPEYSKFSRFSKLRSMLNQKFIAIRRKRKQIALEKERQKKLNDNKLKSKNFFWKNKRK